MVEGWAKGPRRLHPLPPRKSTIHQPEKEQLQRGCFFPPSLPPRASCQWSSELRGSTLWPAPVTKELGAAESFPYLFVNHLTDQFD